MGGTSPHVIGLECHSAFPSLLGYSPSILLLLDKLKTKELCGLLKVMQLAKTNVSLPHSWTHTKLFSQCVLFVEPTVTNVREKAEGCTED